MVVSALVFLEMLVAALCMLLVRFGVIRQVRPAHKTNLAAVLFLVGACGAAMALAGSSGARGVVLLVTFYAVGEMAALIVRAYRQQYKKAWIGSSIVILLVSFAVYGAAYGSHLRESSAVVVVAGASCLFMMYAPRRWFERRG